MKHFHQEQALFHKHEQHVEDDQDAYLDGGDQLGRQGGDAPDQHVFPSKRQLHEKTLLLPSFQICGEFSGKQLVQYSDAVDVHRNHRHQHGDRLVHDPPRQPDDQHNQQKADDDAQDVGDPKPVQPVQKRREEKKHEDGKNDGNGDVLGRLQGGEDKNRGDDGKGRAARPMPAVVFSYRVVIHHGNIIP